VEKRKTRWGGRRRFPLFHSSVSDERVRLFVEDSDDELAIVNVPSGVVDRLEGDGLDRHRKRITVTRRRAAEAAEFVGQINEGLTPGKRSRHDQRS
jgi:hypothetical protein